MWEIICFAVFRHFIIFAESTVLAGYRVQLWEFLTFKRLGGPICCPLTLSPASLSPLFLVSLSPSLTLSMSPCHPVTCLPPPCLSILYLSPVSMFPVSSSPCPPVSLCNSLPTLVYSHVSLSLVSLPVSLT